jgi:glucokinase
MAAADLCVAVDIGGTSVKAALATRADGDITLSGFVTLAPAANDIDALSTAVVTAIRQVGGEHRVKEFAIATTGLVDHHGVVVAGPAFRGYQDFSWQAQLAQRLGGAVRVTVLNDGHAAAVGAYSAQCLGAVDSLALFVVGTGIGGGAICEGRLLRGSRGFAGHFGHLRTHDGGDEVCVCGSTGCVENRCSGRAIARGFLGRAIAPEEVSAGVDAARRALLAGDTHALEVFRRAGEALGVAIGGVANAFDPEVVVLGGGVLAAALEPSGRNILVEAAVAAATEACLDPIARTLRIETASTQGLNLHGAAAYALAAAGSLRLIR